MNAQTKMKAASAHVVNGRTVARNGKAYSAAKAHRPESGFVASGCALPHCRVLERLHQLQGRLLDMVRPPGGGSIQDQSCNVLPARLSQHLARQAQDHPRGVCERSQGASVFERHRRDKGSARRHGPNGLAWQTS